MNDTNSLVSAKIVGIEHEAQDINTYHLDLKLGGKPGQFVMLWVPGGEEKPFSIAGEDTSGIMLTIAKVGQATSEIFKLKVGDKVGIKGPLGKGFDLRDLSSSRIALVGGGYGTAPLSFVASALKQNNEINFFVGARTKQLIIYMEKLKASGYNTYYSTNDGTFGEPGFITDVLKKKLSEKRFDQIYTVGPEMMMKKVVEISDEFGVPCQISLERYMKCGTGVCGSCCVDQLGVRMCVEGPCITKELARQITEFGQYHRDASGRKVKI